MIYCPKCKQLVPENLRITKELNEETHYYDVTTESVCAICGLTVRRIMDKAVNEVITKGFENGKNT